MRVVRSTPPGVAVVDVDEPDGPGELLTISVGEHLRVGLRLHRVRQPVPARPRARRRDRGRSGGRDRGDLRLRRVRPVPRGPVQPVRHDGHDGARDHGRRRDERTVPRAVALTGRAPRRSRPGRRVPGGAGGRGVARVSPRRRGTGAAGGRRRRRRDRARWRSRPPRAMGVGRGVARGALPAPGRAGRAPRRDRRPG